MKRVKISVVIMLLLITLSLILLSGCSVNLEKINEKNAEAIEFGFSTQTVEDNLKSLEDDSDWYKEYSESLVGYDYIIDFRASEEIRTKYDYILSAQKLKVSVKENDGTIIEKNEIYVCPHELDNKYIPLMCIDQSKICFIAFAFLTKEQLEEITFEETKVAIFYKEKVWNKALSVSDKIIEWNL